MNTASPAPNPVPNPASDSAPNSASAASSADQPARLLLKEFQEKFAVFRECRPLAIGIDKQLIAQQPELPRKLLRGALRIHTHSTRYLKAMEKAEVRFNLDGQPAEPVTDAHRQHAGDLLRERAQKHAAQRKQQREVEQAQRKAEQAARQRADKLNQLAAKFSRRGG